MKDIECKSTADKDCTLAVVVKANKDTSIKDSFNVKYSNEY